MGKGGKEGQQDGGLAIVPEEEEEEDGHITVVEFGLDNFLKKFCIYIALRSRLLPSVSVCAPVCFLLSHNFSNKFFTMSKIANMDPHAGMHRIALGATPT